MLRMTKIDAASLPNLPATSKSHSGDGFILFVKVWQNHDEESKRVVGFSSGFTRNSTTWEQGVFGRRNFWFTFNDVQTDLHHSRRRWRFCIPIIIELMGERPFDKYERVFSSLKSKGSMIRIFMADFETVSWSAVRNVFCDAIAKCCCFAIPKP